MVGWHLNRVYRAKVREAFPVCKQAGDAELTISRQFDETAPSFAPPITGPANWPRQDDAPPEQRQEIRSSRYYSAGGPVCDGELRKHHSLARSRKGPAPGSCPVGIWLTLHTWPTRCGTNQDAIRDMRVLHAAHCVLNSSARKFDFSARRRKPNAGLAYPCFLKTVLFCEPDTG